MYLRAQRDERRDSASQTDSRIEAAISRQFGARSLLILPIYDDCAVAGVLEVLFNEAHAFQHREVRSYRLMACLVGEAMSCSARPEQKKVLAADLSILRQNIGQIKPQIPKSLNDGRSVPGAATNRAICQTCGAPIAEAGKLPGLRQSDWAATKRAKRVPLYKGRWKIAAALAGSNSELDCQQRSPFGGAFGTSALQRSNAIEQQAPFVPPKRVLANSTARPQTTPDLKEEARKTVGTTPQWARVGNNELDYVAQHVTVRYFTPKTPPQPVPGRNNQVRYISEDLTVRYFRPKHTIEPPHPVGTAAQPVTRKFHFGASRVLRTEVFG